MRPIKPFLLTTLVLIFCSSLQAQNISLNNSLSTINFQIKNAGFWVDGNLPNYTVEGNFDLNSLSDSHIKATVEVNTISTGINKRDSHLKNEDYFETSKYPQMIINSSSLEKTNTGFNLIGSLTIKDVTKNITIPFTYDSSSKKMVGKFQINRLHYNVGESSWMTGDDVFIEIISVLE